MPLKFCIEGNEENKMDENWDNQRNDRVRKKKRNLLYYFKIKAMTYDRSYLRRNITKNSIAIYW